VKVTETIKGIAELWKLRSVFPDKEALLDTCMQECQITMGHDGSMVGHFPKWTAVIDGAGYTCTCPDHQYRDSQCKHLGALATKIQQNWEQEFPQTTEDNNETN
jgi:hypothetical protein